MSEDKPVAQDPDFFAVEPRFDCPHVDDSMLDNFAGFLRGSLKEYSITSKTHVFAALKCETCQDAKENWVCLGCSKLFCSRYVQGHMAAHNSFSSHQIAFSLGDGSFWCYDCDSYITSVELGKLRKTFGFIKHKIPFGSLKDLSEKERILPILQELEKINDGQSTFKRSEFVEGIRSQKYNKICCITGAGISTSAGIPDFRSQGGLYHRLAVQYDLTTPEEIMTLEFFKKNPEPLYEIMKQFLTSTIKPTNCHKFFAELQKRNQLLKYYTQNIDGLEIDAGLSQDFMIQAHGHIRSCSCCSCKNPADIDELKKAIIESRIYKCGCGFAIKPDVILFGENLPAFFSSEVPKIAGADLVIISGTSLKVYPFAFLVDLIPAGVPVVLVNFDNPLKKGFEKFLFLQGDIEAHFTQLLEELK